MKQRININKPLRVKALYLKGSSTKPLRNRIVYIAGNFLIVAQDEQDTAPTWYNVDRVDKLEGVEEIPEPPRTRQQAFFF